MFPLSASPKRSFQDDSTPAARAAAPAGEGEPPGDGAEGMFKHGTGPGNVCGATCPSIPPQTGPARLSKVVKEALSELLD